MRTAFKCVSFRVFIIVDWLQKRTLRFFSSVFAYGVTNKVSQHFLMRLNVAPANRLIGPLQLKNAVFQVKLRLKRRK